MAIYYKSFDSPVGWLSVFEEDKNLIAIETGKAKKSRESSFLARIKQVVLEYFSKDRLYFNIPVKPQGSNFQLAVWREISKIPYGETKTYGSIAKTLQTSPRAVGMACGKNPIPIFIPCHRVVGTGNALGGFSFGAKEKTKLYLLNLETTCLNSMKPEHKALRRNDD